MRLIVAFAALLIGGPIAAQAPSRATVPRARAPRAVVDHTTPTPGSELTVYLVTMGQGDAIWEKFGHSAIWIHDGATGRDVAYNWGLFDFEQPGFLRRFLRGRMEYWMAGFDARPMIDFYIEANRTVVVQRLHLSPAQRDSLRRFVEWNELPENKYYRYDYYRDNCSTRVRDAIDRVLGGQVRRATDTVATGTTYRSHTRRLMEGSVGAYTGIELGLGHPADQELSEWEEMFLPVPMHDIFARLRVHDEATGALVPLVEESRTLFVAQRPPEPLGPPRWLPYYLIAGAAFGTALALLAVAARRGSGAGRAGFVVLGALWSIVVGLLGTFLILAWTATDHVFTRNNENVLQATPLSLALVVLLPLLAYRDRAPRAAARLATIIAALSALGFVMQALPAVNQVNGEIIALVLPVQIGIAWGAWRLARPSA